MFREKSALLGPQDKPNPPPIPPYSPNLGSTHLRLCFTTLWIDTTKAMQGVVTTAGRVKLFA